MKRNFILITISFIISFLALVIITITIKQRLKYTASYNDAVVHTYMVISQLHQVESFVKDAETGTRGYLLSGDSVFLLPYLSSIKKVHIAIDSLQFLLSDNRSQLNRCKLLQVDIKEKMSIMAYYTFLKSKNEVLGITDGMRKGNFLMTQIRNAILKMTNTEEGLLAIRKDEKEKYEGITPGYLSFSLGVSLIITIISFFFILREFKIRMRYQNQLETTIEALSQSNEELQQIAEISSHDLQEPLRKVRLFSSKLLYGSKNLLDANAKTTIDRINASTQQMQLLIDDVVTYFNISKTALVKEDIDANRLIIAISDDYVINNGLQIFVEKMPKITGDKKQLAQLFKQLIDNAVKYKKPVMPPFLKIGYELVDDDFLGKNKGKKTFHKISFADNGIGFNEEYTHKLFTIFRRLHGQKSDYKGKGIGLAMCKKILLNHNGYITANSVENIGATFTIYFPA